MDRIERAVVLPPGAKPLGAYARHYAFSGPHTVGAVYLIPMPPLDAKLCHRAQGAGLRPCTNAEFQQDVRSQPAQAPAGERRWHLSVSGLPQVVDGGCRVVQLAYDVAAGRLTSIACQDSV